jgi:hypothetical protein
MILDGIYETQSNAVYKIINENSNHYKFLYWEPNTRQKECGIKKGDVAFKGTLLSNILLGTFYQYYSLNMKEKCPENWENPTPIMLKVSGNEKTIIGDLLEERLQDNCKKDARRIIQLKFIKLK